MARGAPRLPSTTPPPPPPLTTLDYTLPPSREYHVQQLPYLHVHPCQSKCHEKEPLFAAVLPYEEHTVTVYIIIEYAN